jgi:hypothetical protein
MSKLVPAMLLLVAALTTPTRAQDLQTHAPSEAENTPVAHRAALLIEAPDDLQRVKTFVGTVLWRLDRMTGSLPTLIADIDLPDARFKAAIRISKNTDSSLPASHTIDLRFMPAPDGEIPDVKEIDTLQMRAEDRPAGEPLSGVPAGITSNYFLVGLNAGDSAQARNLDLMRNRGWFDLPMLLVNGKIAKITFEKGKTGDRTMNDALAAWQSGHPPTPPKPPLRPRPAPATEEKPLNRAAIAKLLDKPEDALKPSSHPRSDDAISTMKPRFDAHAIAEVLSREAPGQRPSAVPQPSVNAVRMSPSRAAEIDGFIIDRYKRCWTLPHTEKTTYLPVIKLTYNTDGTLNGPPLLINPATEPNDRVIAESALQAIRHPDCNPMRFPANFMPYFDQWRGPRILRFDPTEVLNVIPQGGVFSEPIKVKSIPVAGPAPSINSEKAENLHSFTRSIVSGGKGTLMALLSINPDCTSTGPMDTKILTEPKHGILEITDGNAFPSFPRENVRYACNSKKVPAKLGVYRAQRGFQGDDEFVVRSIDSVGNENLYKYLVHVR